MLPFKREWYKWHLILSNPRPSADLWNYRAEIYPPGDVPWPMISDADLVYATPNEAVEAGSRAAKERIDAALGRRPRPSR